MKPTSVAIVLVVLAGVGAYAYYRHGQPEAKASAVEVALTRGNIVQAVQASGTLQAVRNVQVGSQVSGVVKALHADFNSIVRKGQIIAELDSSLLEVQVEVQQANVERQEGEIAQQEVQLQQDQMTLTRTRALFDRGLVSAQQIEAAELQVSSRQAAVEAARKQLVQAKAGLHQAELNVSYCTIRSPVDGVVVDRKVDIGQTVQASMTTPEFFAISTDLTTLRLSALVDEADIGAIRRGMPVTFTVDAYGQQSFSGTVDAVRLDAQTANNVVTYPVWITVQNADLRLLPSMTASLRITVDRADDVVRVPNQALRFRPTSEISAWLGAAAPAPTRPPAGSGRVGQSPGPEAAIAEMTEAIPLTERGAQQIDDLFAQVQKRVQPAQVWLYDEHAADPAQRLRSVAVRVGLSDGQFSELVAAEDELSEGAMVVTGVTPPPSATTASSSNNIFAPTGGRGRF